MFWVHKLPKKSSSYDISGVDKSAGIDDFQKMFFGCLIPGGGWVPRHTYDPKMVIEFHAWCVDEKGLVHDYPDHQLIRGKYGTRDLVRSRLM